MKMSVMAVLGVGLLTLGNGCVMKYSHAVSASQATQGSTVEAEASGVGVLMLSAPDLNASDALKAKCPTGKLSNVETQSRMRNFLIVQLYGVDVRGICNP